MRLKQIASGITNPDTYPSGSGAWTNAANIRDSGDPPTVDGTNGTFANATATGGTPIVAMRVATPNNLSASAYWAGIAIDWEMVSTDGGTMACYGEATDTLIGQFASVALETGRKRSYFPFSTASGVDFRKVGNLLVTVSLRLTVGGGSLAQGRIYEVGMVYMPRADAVEVDG